MAEDIIVTDLPAATVEGGEIVYAVQDGADVALTLGPAAGRAIGPAADQVAAGDHGHAGVYQPAAGLLAAIAALPSGAGLLLVDSDGGVALEPPGAAADHGHGISKNGGAAISAESVNLVEGTGISLLVAESPGGQGVDVTIAAAGGGDVTPPEVLFALSII